MARPRSKPAYEAGPVRVSARGGGYRLRWVELNVERERTTKTLDEATRLADSVAARLAFATNGAVSGAAAFGSLCEAWMDAYSPRWGAGHCANVQSILVQHVNPSVGNVACDRLTDTSLQNIVLDMAEGEFSEDWMAAVVKVLRAVGQYGVKRRVWSSEHNPAADLLVPQIDRLVPRTLIPTAEQVNALADAAAASTKNATQQMRRRWMVRVAAGCGLRWGEMCVLTADDVDLDAREVRITKAWHPKEPPARRLGPPKSRHSVRTVIIPAADLQLWRDVVAAADGGVLAKPARGAVWNASYWSNKVWPKLVEQVENWPDRAGYHFLRHYAIVSWLDAAIPPGNVSRLAGHHSAEFTWKRYVGPQQDYLDVARQVL
jgi:integrase